MKKYYPLIDMDSTGTITVPMFPAYDYKTALRTSSFALEEISPHRYRLIAVTPHAMWQGMLVCRPIVTSSSPLTRHKSIITLNS